MEDGIYRAKPLGAVLGKTSKGAEQVGIEFEFIDSPDRMTYYGTFSDAAMPITFKALRISGWQGDDLSDLSSIGGDTAPEVSLVVENEEWEGKWRSKVKWVNAAGGLAMKDPLTENAAKAFAAKMRGHVLAFDRANGGAAKPSAPPAQPRRQAPSSPPPQGRRAPEPPPLGDDDMPPF